MKKVINFLLSVFCTSTLGLSQGLNNNWLIGYLPGPVLQATSGKAIIDFNNGQPLIFAQLRKMYFEWTQANLSDHSGNLLMSTNGIFIADASGDTMLNGSGINPSQHTTNWIPFGLNLPDADLFLPYPGDTSKYILFHETSTYSPPTCKLYYSIIDITLNGGLGAVTQKNLVATLPQLNGGIAACKHANGRDWWILMPEDSSNVIWKILLTNQGIASITSQAVSAITTFHSSVSQVKFSQDGKRFAFTTQRYLTIPNAISYIQYFNFNRCTGVLSEAQYIPIMGDHRCFGLSFSPNSKFLYTCSPDRIYQCNLDSVTADTVAIYDGFVTPPGGNSNQFVLMYLANDGRIYISSASSTLNLHYINYPDSEGVACDVRQHALPIPCYHYGAVPTHANYFLGADTGSVCDTLLSMKNSEFRVQNEKIAVFPNPAREQFTVYQWQAHENYFVLIDAMGREVIRKKISGKESIINTDALQQGIYFWSCANQRGKINVLK